MRDDRLEPLLRAGETCWRIARADRFALIIDAADYFRAAKAALLCARRRALLIGWDFDVRVALEPDGGSGGARLDGPNRIGRFLNWLSKRRPGLAINILKWDLGLLQSLARGETPLVLARWASGRRIRLKLDGAHPPAAAHHMKLLTIDGSLAFCGGIDIVPGRWDTRRHRDKDPARRSPLGRRMDPWHDATTCTDGDLARALDALAQMRWERATGEALPVIDEGTAPWPEDITPVLRDVDIGIARTIAAYDGHRQVSEIEALTLAAIAAVRRTLYVESQYFASRRIAEAMAERLGEADGPEIVLMNPLAADGWLESKVMDSARTRLLHMIGEADRHDRFRIFHPVNAAGTPIYVHAKIMIVDDRLLKIGSANLNNRSMGFDTECDLAVDAALAEDAETVRRAILRCRDDLIGEHIGLAAEAVAPAIEAAGGSLVALLDEKARETGRIRPITPDPLGEDEKWLAESDLLDPESHLTIRGILGKRLRRWLPF